MLCNVGPDTAGAPTLVPHPILHSLKKRRNPAAVYFFYPLLCRRKRFWRWEARLGAVSYVSSLSELVLVMVKIEAAGGIDCIATAIHISQLQRSACGTLNNLAIHADNCVKIEAVGGIDCIAKAMRSHPTNSWLQSNACGALSNLGIHVKIEAAGGIEYIATAMRNHPTNSWLQSSACKALSNLAQNADIQAKIEAVGGMDCIADAMRSHPTNIELQDIGSRSEK